MHKTIIALLFPLLAAGAFARDAIPVNGPAHAGVEDPDVLEKTVLDIGVLAVNAEKPYSLRVGDGVTPGGVEVHAESCITNFDGICNATTNLNMYNYSITYGPWSTRGDADTFTLARGSNAWLRLVREDGQAYVRYEFAILDGFGVMDASHYQFTVANVEGDPLPVLEVSTNLLEGYTAADTNAIVTTRTDASHVSLVYEAPAGVEFIFFRMFKTEELTTGAHFYVPVVAESGITMGTNTWTEWPDIDGKIADATISLASTAAVAAVSGRVDAIEEQLEYPETCALYWPTAYITNTWDTVTKTINIPTNFPTRRLDLVVSDQDLERLNINFDYFDPGRDCEVVLTEYRSSAAPTNRYLSFSISGVEVWNVKTAGSNFRITTIDFETASATWTVRYWNGLARHRYSTPEYNGPVPITRPATVEEWMALRGISPYSASPGARAGAVGPFFEKRRDVLASGRMEDHR